MIVKISTTQILKWYWFCSYQGWWYLYKWKFRTKREQNVLMPQQKGMAWLVRDSIKKEQSIKEIDYRLGKYLVTRTNQSLPTSTLWVFNNGLQYQSNTMGN